MPGSRRLGLHRQTRQHRPVALIAPGLAVPVNWPQPFSFRMNVTTKPAKETKAAVTPVDILLVDDKAENLVVLESILEGPEYRLTKAQSAQEALMALI